MLELPNAVLTWPARRKRRRINLTLFLSVPSFLWFLSLKEKRRPWKCNVCGISFGRKSTLVRHMATVCSTAVNPSVTKDKQSAEGTETRVE